jgi:hypothetical protein
MQLELEQIVEGNCECTVICKCAKPLNSSLRMRRKPVLSGGRYLVGARADCGEGTAHAQSFVNARSL